MDIIVPTRLRRIKSWRDGLFDDQSTLIIGIAILPESGWIHTSSSAWVDGLFPDHLVKHPIIISLNYGSMVIAHKLLVWHVWIFRSDQLRLHPVGHWLISVITNCGGILNAVWTHASDPAWIYTNCPIS